MNCRDFLAEFEERRDALSQPARLHRDDCPDCKKTSVEQTRVWQMIDGLNRIDAPNDFDFRVKAKIAGAQPANLQSRFFPILRYVLPLSLIVMVFGLLAFNTTLFFGNNGASQVADAVSQTPTIAELPLSDSSMPNEFVATGNSLQFSPGENDIAEDSNIKPATKERETQFVSIKSVKKPLTESRKESPKDNSDGNSRVKAATSTTILLPENLDANKTVETLPNAGNQNPITDVQILDFIGIEVVSENTRKRVKAVKPDSSAERSGVKVGDVIEAIDGVKLSAEPVNAKKIEVKKLTVARDAEKIEITLKN